MPKGKAKLLERGDRLLISDRLIHRQLYREIPAMKCIAGCTDCCGPVPLTEYEARRLGVDGAFTSTNDNGKCVFAKSGKCEVYDKRPLLCRIFGTVETERMLCPHGMKPEKPLSREKEIVIIRRYDSMKFSNDFPDQLENILTNILQNL